MSKKNVKVEVSQKSTRPKNFYTTDEVNETILKLQDAFKKEDKKATITAVVVASINEMAQKYGIK